MLTIVAVSILLPIATSLAYLYFTSYLGVFKKHQLIQSSHALLDSTEVNDPITLSVERGEIPPWLNGIMYRIGPGRFHIKQNDGATYAIRHAFDGLPFMHRFRIDGQSQTLKYNSRMLAKSLEKTIESKSHKGLVFFGHIPNLNFFEWLYEAGFRFANMVLFKKPRNKNSPSGQSVGVTVTPNFPLPSSIAASNGNDNVLVSKTDVNVLQKVHAETLEPERIFSYSTFDRRIKGEISAAHHQSDPFTKETFNFAQTAGPVPRLVAFSTSQEGKVTILADFTHHHDGKTPFRASYIHSFWLTENYVIIPETPMAFLDKGINMLLQGSFISSMTWDANAPTYCHVIERHPKQEGKGLIASIPVNPGFFTFHVGNAFETINEQGQTVLNLDAASFSDGDIIHQLHAFGTPHYKGSYKPPKEQSKLNGVSYPPIHQKGFGDYKRYTLNLGTGKLLSIQEFIKNFEFPRFNQAYTFKGDSSFVYGCELQAFTEKRDESGALVKIDLRSNTVLKYGEEGFNCSEPIFVPNPTSTNGREDDGILLSLANNFDCCYLVVVDAVDMKELARIRIGQFTAVTFHGSYVDHEFESVNIN